MNPMLAQAIANLEIVAREMRDQISPSCSMDIPETYVQCWHDNILTAVSDLKEVEPEAEASNPIVRTTIVPPTT